MVSDTGHEVLCHLCNSGVSHLSNGDDITISLTSRLQHKIQQFMSVSIPYSLHSMGNSATESVIFKKVH